MKRPAQTGQIVPELFGSPGALPPGTDQSRQLASVIDEGFGEVLAEAEKGQQRVKFLRIFRNGTIPGVPFQVDQGQIRVGDIGKEGHEQGREASRIPSCSYPPDVLRAAIGVVQDAPTEPEDLLRQ